MEVEADAEVEAEVEAEAEVEVEVEGHKIPITIQLMPSTIPCDTIIFSWLQLAPTSASKTNNLVAMDASLPFLIFLMATFVLL